MATATHAHGETASAPGATSLQCVVVTPERAVLDQVVDSVVVTMYDGELGVLPGRAPLIGRLGYGELRTTIKQETRHYYVDGGFVQIRDNVVTVLTPQAIPAEQIKPEAAEQALRAAQAPALTPEARDAQIKDQERARARLRVARRIQEANT